MFVLLFAYLVWDDDIFKRDATSIGSTLTHVPLLNNREKWAMSEGVGVGWRGEEWRCEDEMEGHRKRNRAHHYQQYYSSFTSTAQLPNSKIHYKNY